MRVYQAAKELKISDAEVIRLLDLELPKPVNPHSWGPTKFVASQANRLTAITDEQFELLKRKIARAKKPPMGEVKVSPTVVRRGKEVQSAPAMKAPVIVITADQAALLSLQSPTGYGPAPARKFRVEVVPPLDGLAALDVVARKVTPEWKRRPKTDEDLSDMYEAIAFGACGLLAQKRAEAAAKKEPNPIGERPAFMREEITVKIQTKISTAARKAVADVISGRRGYSNVLQESVAVRAHFAKYHTGKGRTEVTPILRAAHRRGGPGDKQRKYKVKA